MIVDILRSMTKKSYHTCFYKTYFCKVQLVCIKVLSLTVATHMNISLVVDGKKMSDSYLNCNTVLDIPYTTFPDLQKQRAKESPEEVVCIFIDDDRTRSTLTFGDLYEKATKIAKTLVQMGVKRGDIIGLNGRNVPEWLIPDLGVQMAGGCSLCLPYQQKEETMVELFDAIGDVKLLIIDTGSSGQNCHIIKNMLDKNSTSGKNDPAEVSELLQIILFHQHEAFPSLNNVQDLCSREVDAVLPRIDPEDT